MRCKKDTFRTLFGGFVFALIVTLALPAGASAQYLNPSDSHTIGNSSCGSQVDLHTIFYRSSPSQISAAVAWLNTDVNFFGQNIDVRNLTVASTNIGGIPNQQVSSSTFGVTLVSSSPTASWAWGGSTATTNPTPISTSYPLFYGASVDIFLDLASIDQNDLGMGIYGGNGANGGSALNGMISTDLMAEVEGSLVVNFGMVKLKSEVMSQFDLYRYDVRMSSKVYPSSGGALVNTIYGPMKAKVALKNYYKIKTFSFPAGFSWGPWNLFQVTPLWGWSVPATINPVQPYASF